MQQESADSGPGERRDVRTLYVITFRSNPYLHGCSVSKSGRVQGGFYEGVFRKFRSVRDCAGSLCRRITKLVPRKASSEAGSDNREGTDIGD